MPGIFAAALPNPGSGIFVPLVTAIADRAERPFDLMPALLFVEGALDRMRDECASLPAPGEAIYVAHQSVIQAYV